MTLYYTLTYTDTDNIKTKRWFRSKELRNRFVLHNQFDMRGVRYGTEEV